MNTNDLELTIAFWSCLILANVMMGLGSIMAYAWLAVAIITWIVKLFNRKNKEKSSASS